MRYCLTIVAVCLLFLAACSAATVDEQPTSGTPALDESQPGTAGPTGANPTRPLLPTTLVPMASATRAAVATSGAAEPVVVTVVAGPTSLPLNQVTPAATPTWAAPTPIATLPTGAGPTTLKYLLLDQYPGHFYCDPDEYPVARGDEDQLARDRFAQIQANQEEFQAILARLGWTGQTSFSDEEKLAVYRQHKQLAAVLFESVGDAYRFQFQILEQDGQGNSLTGLIDGQGTVTDLVTTPGTVSCPICLAAGTLIATPLGPAPVELLQPGDLVWTLDVAGRRVVARLLRVGRTSVPASHRVVHLVLEDGRELWASAGHPTADGHALGELGVGEQLDGVQIVSATVEFYRGSATYDILPAGATGVYWAGDASGPGGILLASTLSGR